MTTIDLASCVAAIPDRRRAEGKIYSQVGVILFSIIAMLSGARSYQHRLDEKPVVLGGHPYRSFAPRKQILDALPLIIAQSITSRHRSAPPIRPTAYDSRKTNLGNLEG